MLRPYHKHGEISLPNRKRTQRAQNPNQTVSEANCQKVIAEYKSSAKLTWAVHEEYDKRYQFTKSKIKAAGFDPILLGFSNEESKVEEEEKHSPDP